MASISTQLAGFYKKLTYDDIPKEKIADIRWLVLDYLGVASMGSSTQSGRAAIQHALNQGSHPVATLIGSQRKAVPLRRSALAPTILYPRAPPSAVEK